MAARTTVGVGLGEVRWVGVHVQDHVGCVESYGRVGMSGEIVEELFAFFIVDLVPLACSLAMVLRAMRTVRSTARE
jgi:hypothetical protein